MSEGANEREALPFNYIFVIARSPTVWSFWAIWKFIYFAILFWRAKSWFFSMNYTQSES